MTTGCCVLRADFADTLECSLSGVVVHAPVLTAANILPEMLWDYPRKYCSGQKRNEKQK